MLTSTATTVQRDVANHASLLMLPAYLDAALRDDAEAVRAVGEHVVELGTA